MTDNHSEEDEIIHSWLKNASPWIKAVRREEIESRRLVTDRAIVEAVLSCQPHTVIDLGCGEGWLTRELAEHGLQVTGIDVVPELIEAARQSGKGEFKLLSYSDIASGNFINPVDALVCNFSLLGDESVENLLGGASKLLNPQGVLIIQTLHPVSACGDETYQDGWRAGSWSGFSDDFTDPAPWYFRMLGSWIKLLSSYQWQLRELIEPIHPTTGQPASVIFIAERATRATSA